MVNPDELVAWLEHLIADYEFDVIGLARRNSPAIYPLPTEPGTLGNILETTALGYLDERLPLHGEGVVMRHGTQRKYPDAELFGGRLGDHVVALDVKVARRAKPPARTTGAHRTQARITLLTGNTYFRFPSKPNSNIMRPYAEYALHLDWIILFDIDADAKAPEVTSVDSIITETWRIASTKRSSETRNYIGAVNSIADLKQRKGEFATQNEFESWWRTYGGWRETPEASAEPLGEETPTLLELDG